MASARADNIKTPEFRGSFVHLFEREKKANGDDGLFSILLLIPKKTDNWMQDIPWLWENISQCLNNQFPGGQGMPPVFGQYGQGKPWPVSDGDIPNGMGNLRDEERGHWVLRTGSGNFNPAKNLLDGQTNGLGTLTAMQCYSGCYFRVQGNCYYYQKDGSVGIAFGMNNVCMTREGESLGGGGVDAATAFGVEAATSTAATAFQPGAPAPAAAAAPVAAPAPAPAPVAAPAPVGAAPVYAPPVAAPTAAPAAAVPSFMQ